MKQLREAPKDWPLGNILWFAVLVWFSSSLLSQSAYMAIHGLPYDAVSMLESLGPFYYVVVLLEVAMWGSLLFMGWIKLSRARRASPRPPSHQRKPPMSDVRFWSKNDDFPFSTSDELKKRQMKE